MILEAIRRREVNYTEEGRIAMLPQPLQNTLNLKAGKTHPAVTFTITFHDGYMTPSLDMHLTAVHIDYNLTYDMADLLYMGNKNVAPMLQDADVLAQRLAEHRRRRWERIQAIDGKDPGNISARIVAEFMTLLNTLVGKYMSKKPGTPALYLEHSASVEGHRYSRYTTDPLSAYKGKAIARVTSPVRSADSMINHIQLLAKVFKQGEAFSAEQLQEICDYLNEPYDALAQQ